MNKNEPIPQEAYYPLSFLFTTLGVSLSIMGVLNVLEGCGNNAPAMRELGERQLKIGGNFVFLSSYIKKGILPEPEIMEYLTTRRVPLHTAAERNDLR